MTRRLATTTAGEPLLGDEVGYVSLPAALPGATTIRDGLRAAAAGALPDPAEAPAVRVPADHRSFGPALPEPGTLLGIGLNYADHAADLDETAPEEPASFIKPPGTAVGPDGPIRLPPRTETARVTAEAELAVVVGRRCSDVAPDEVDDVVAGLLPVIDVTAEDVLERNPRFLTRAKSYDSFLVLGGELVVRGTGDLAETTVRTVVDDAVVAENRVAAMHASPRELVAVHSRVMTLSPGDVICTGTPGAGVIRRGSRVRATVEGVGRVAADVVGGPTD